MGILQAAGIALLSAMLIALLKEWRAPLAPPVRLAAAVVLFSAAVCLFLPVLDRVRQWSALSDTGEFTGPLLRAVGIALLCELSASFCRDLGENTIAEGVLLFGKLEILLLALPFADRLISLAGEMLQW